jgi:uracil-DNA glycosylase family 4
MNETLNQEQIAALLEVDKSKRKHPLAECENCPLIKQPCAPTIGPANAKIAVVSRSPGKYEAQKGEPFSGPSGKILDHLLKQNGVTRDEVLLTNVVLCHTDKPTKEAIAACSPRLRSELVNADTIVAAGGEATTELTGSKSVGGNRGFRHRRIIGASSGRQQEIVVTNNPALVFKDDSVFLDLVKDFKLAINPRPAPTLPEVNWTNDPETAKRWLSEILEQEPAKLACDIESRGLAHTARLAAIGLSTTGRKAVSFGERCTNNEVVFGDYLRPLLENQERTYIWHNGKFDVRNLRHKGINARVDEDTLLMSYALDERSDEEGVHSLDYLLHDVLAWPDYEPYVVEQWKQKIGQLEKARKWKELDELPIPDELYDYNGLDTAGTMQLHEELEPRLKEDQVELPYRRLLIPGSEALTTMELAGMPYNVPVAADLLEEEVWPKLGEFKLQLQLKVGDGNYNPNSAPQNAALVYDKWEVTHDIDRGPDRERSVDKAVYRELKEGRFTFKLTDDPNLELRRATVIEWAKLFEEFKLLDKQRSTYIESLIPRAEVGNGRIYTDLNLHGTVSGRPASRNPNLLNITRPKEGLPNIRKLFVARKGHKIVSADYSQAELRCIAKLSRSRGLSKIYADRVSLHKQVAERFYGPDYNKEQYTYTKNMNFGVAYGQSPETFQEKHDIPVDEAKKFVKWWKSEFPEVFTWSKEVQQSAIKNGYVQTEWGRKRRFYLITPQNIGEIKREAVNFLPQSTAADFTLYSLIRLAGELDPAMGSLCLTVYDSIIGEFADNYVMDAAKIIKQVMESTPKDALKWDFPFEAEVAIGPSWGEVKEIEV